MDPLGYKRALVGRRESPGRTQFNAQLNRHGSVNITVRPMDPNGMGVMFAPGARVRPSTNNWVSYQPTIGYLTNYQPTIGYLTNQLLGILPTNY